MAGGILDWLFAPWSMGSPKRPQRGQAWGACFPAPGFQVGVGCGMSPSLDMAESWLKASLGWGALSAVDLSPGFSEPECPAHQKPPSQPRVSTGLRLPTCAHTSAGEESKWCSLSWNRKTEAKWGTSSHPILDGQPCCCGLYGKSCLLILRSPSSRPVLGFNSEDRERFHLEQHLQNWASLSSLLCYPVIIIFLAFFLLFSILLFS